ncbi:MAG: hypothetical protein HQL53_06120 [Magnetococcales bacterium]|nr:hypothetical protein [Magnetococcales bacterium]
MSQKGSSDNKGLDELMRMLKDNPAAVVRVHKYLRGELPTMVQHVVPLRLAVQYLERLDRLVDGLRPTLSEEEANALTRAKMVERVILRGCESYEQELEGKLPE